MKKSILPAFSLAELLVVLGIAAVLMALAVPAFNSITGGQNISAAADSLGARLEYARQYAVTENERIELRILKTLPKDGTSRPVYNATQLVRVSTNQAVDNPVFLPMGIEVLDELAYSTLLSDQNPLPEAANSTTTVSGVENIPYKAILFRADGSTHLSPNPPAAGSNAWTFTVVQSKRIPQGGGLPTNFGTVMVDPVTGRSTVYRP